MPEGTPVGSFDVGIELGPEDGKGVGDMVGPGDGAAEGEPVGM